MMELRPYQEQAVNSILGEWEQGHQHTLLVLPTGTGKTVVFSKVVEKEVNKGEKVSLVDSFPTLWYTIKAKKDSESSQNGKRNKKDSRHPKTTIAASPFNDTNMAQRATNAL